MKSIQPPIMVISMFMILSCGSSHSLVNQPQTFQHIDVAINDVPFKTIVNLRVPYTLRCWDFQTEGLVLDRIEVLNGYTKDVISILNQKELPIVHRFPIVQESEGNQGPTHCYFSLQLPISLDKIKPGKLIHRLVFNDKDKQNIIVEGGALSLRLDESPRVIASPVNGERWLLLN